MGEEVGAGVEVETGVAVGVELGAGVAVGVTVAVGIGVAVGVGVGPNGEQEKLAATLTSSILAPASPPAITLLSSPRRHFNLML